MFNFITDQFRKQQSLDAFQLNILMGQQLKEGLLLHLQQNKNFVEQKVYKQFAVECLQEENLAKLDKNKMIQTIKFIFDFGNQQMNEFYEKLPTNIQRFVNQKIQALKKKALFDLEILIDMITYCVNNGFDKKPKEIKKQKPVQSKGQQIQQAKPIKKANKVQAQIKSKKKQNKKVYKPEEQFRSVRDNPEVELISFQKKVKKQKQNTAKPRIQTHLDLPKIEKVQFKIEKHTMPQKNVMPRYLQIKNVQPIKIEPYQPQQFQFEHLDQKFIQKNQNILKERLRSLYQHYCSQQQNNGHSPTFDKIKSQMQQMTIGKFLLFLKSTKIFHLAKLIKKQNILSIYRKISQGRQQITFQQFSCIIKILDQKYVQELKTSKNLEIPSFQARLMLQDPERYKQFKKNINMIFFTRDNKNALNTLTQSYRRDLTSHSGKTARQLQQDLQRKQYQSIDLSRTIQKEKTKKVQNFKKINLKDIQSSNFPILDWLQEEERNDEETNKNLSKINQKSFLNSQKRRDIIGSMKKRIDEVSRLQQKTG